MTWCYLLRHGETRWNADGNRYCGHSDIELTERGEQQAREAALTLANIPFTAAYASTLGRARETARLALGERELPIQIDARLIECGFGEWEGKMVSEIQRDAGADWQAWRTDPANSPAGVTGETATAVAARMTAAMRDIAAANPHGVVLIVGHSTSNRLLIVDSMGAPLTAYRALTQDNLGCNIVHWRENSVLWRRINMSLIDRDPLPAPATTSSTR